MINKYIIYGVPLFILFFIILSYTSIRQIEISLLTWKDIIIIFSIAIVSIFTFLFFNLFNNCPSQCSLNGDCNIFTQTCSCHPGFSGSDCSNIVCPKNCSYNGTCNPDGTCTCYNGFFGNDCSEILCPNNCSLNGTCDYKTGTCTCLKGWKGTDCSTPDFECINNCSQNGTCNRSNGTCSCKDNWEGIDCSIPIKNYSLIIFISIAVVIFIIILIVFFIYRKSPEQILRREASDRFDPVRLTHDTRTEYLRRMEATRLMEIDRLRTETEQIEAARLADIERRRSEAETHAEVEKLRLEAEQRERENEENKLNALRNLKLKGEQHRINIINKRNTMILKAIEARRLESERQAQADRQKLESQQESDRQKLEAQQEADRKRLAAMQLYAQRRAESIIPEVPAAIVPEISAEIVPERLNYNRNILAAYLENQRREDDRLRQEATRVEAEREIVDNFNELPEIDERFIINDVDEVRIPTVYEEEKKEGDIDEIENELNPGGGDIEISGLDQSLINPYQGLERNLMNEGNDLMNNTEILNELEALNPAPAIRTQTRQESLDNAVKNLDMKIGKINPQEKIRALRVATGLSNNANRMLRLARLTGKNIANAELNQKRRFEYLQFLNSL
jgi:hypothetical protein